ncbi:tetratricopeptide repeat protein [Cesiribacter sp. SM1]|uniref:tetratricopeptide repeat protein n=1 Tax=Cesiribacter sp. SM1 TaxID=2861196 RepID=UPI001CD2FDA5|nr:tetratricopeptide repeat protein [Cesiribacter sp. SM1]
MNRLYKYYCLLAIVLFVAISCNPEETGEKIHAVPASSSQYYQDALQAVSETIDQYPNNPDGYYQKARILEALGNKNNAILSLKRAVKLDSSNTLYHKELARLFLATGKHKRAEESVQVAWQLGDRTASTLAILTQVHAEQGGYAQAMNFLNKALEAEPHNSQLVFQKGKLYMMQGDTARAKAHLEQNLPNISNQPEIYEILSDIYRKEKNYRQALAYMRKSASLQPEKEELPMQIVEILLEAGRPDSAQVVLLDIQRKRGEKPDLMLLIARLQMEQNRADSAEYYINRTLALDSRSKEAYFWLGKLYDKKRQYYTAREQYRNALLIDTTYQEARQGLQSVEITLERIERWKQQQAQRQALPEINTVKPKAVEQ